MADDEEKITNRLTRGSQPARAPVADAGRFKKGHAKAGGRRKGVQNAVTRELKEAVLNAAAKHGFDGKGKDGLEGYMTMLAYEDKRIFSTFLRVLLPMQMNVTTEVERVPYKTVEEIDRELAACGLPPMRDLFVPDYRGTAGEPERGGGLTAEVSAPKALPKPLEAPCEFPYHKLETDDWPAYFEGLRDVIRRLVSASDLSEDEMRAIQEDLLQAVSVLEKWWPTLKRK